MGISGERTSYWAIHLFPGGDGGLASRLGTDARTKKKKKKKNDEKGYFFQARHCAALSSFRVRKIAFILVRNGWVFSNLIKNAVIRGKIQTENIVKRGPFCGEHSEKGTCY